MSKYVSLSNLARYDGKLQALAQNACAIKNAPDAMWRQTEKAGAVSLWPVGNSPLEGNVEFMFKESGPASGTKSPDNPSTISGISSVKATRCGKNLCPRTILYNNQSGVTITANTDGSFTFNGTASGDLYAMLFNETSSTSIFPSFLNKGSTYILSLIGNDQNIKFRVSIAVNNTWVGGVAAYVGSGQTAQITIPSNATGCILRFEAAAGTVFDNSIVKVQLELGSVATSFEPYDDTDYALSLGGTYYGGAIDLATGLMTVTHHAFRLGDYQDSIAYNSENSRWQVIVRPRADYTVNPICTHSIFDQTSVYTNATDGYFRWAAGGSGTWWYFKSPATTLSDFMAIYADAYIVYKLYEPQTVQLSPLALRSLVQPDKYVPRPNTVYTDADAVQIVYQKNPVRDKFEKVQAIIAQGGNV